MSNVIYVAGLLVIGGLATWGVMAATKRNIDDEVRKFAATVPAPLTDHVWRWLRIQLARRSTYPILGAIWLSMAGNTSPSSDWYDPPWAWFVVAVLFGAGITMGTLLAGYRTAPLLDGPMRTVDPVRRRVSDSLSAAGLRQLRLAAVVSGAGLALAVAITSSSDSIVEGRLLLATGLGVVLVAAHYWVVRAVITRPMVASTPEGLIWQKALLAETVEGLPFSAFYVAMFSAVIAVFATAVAYRDLPLIVVLLSVCFALVAAASAGEVILSSKRIELWLIRRGFKHGVAP